ncbi:MAG: BMP family ABC transporter substrate-binding protein [Spirochaetaceae bacterium]|nr:BMP family ABC transporter substrate-binding protein [Spirochaetaceae bacterium]
MKKTTLILLTITLLACGNYQQENIGLKVIQVTEAGGVTDGSFNQDVFYGISRFFAANPLAGSYSYVASPSHDLLEQTVRNAADENPTVLITAGFNFIDIIARVAPLYPAINFILVDGFVDLPNVKSIVYNEYNAGFLAGQITALAALRDGLESPVFATIEGMEVPAVVAYRNGFMAGIIELIPAANFERLALNNWTDAATARSFALMLRQRHGDNLYAIKTMAGSANGGAISFARELHQQGERLFIVGVDTDMYAMGLVSDGHSVVLTSALKLCNVDIYNALHSIVDGTFTSGLTEGETGFSATNILVQGLVLP